MKKFILVFSLLLYSFFSFAQSWLWAREATPRNNGVNSGVGDVFGNHGTAADYRGNVFITGFSDWSLSFGADTIGGGNGDVFLVKYCPSGNVLWARQANQVFHGKVAGDGQGNGVATDASGDVYVVGQMADTLSFGTIVLKALPNTYNAFLVKYDADGNVIWGTTATQRNVNYSGYANSVTTDPVGNVYVTGVFNRMFQFGTFSLVNASAPAAFLVKYNAGGNVVWAAQSTSASSASGAGGVSVALDNIGNFYVTGTFYDTVSFGSVTLIAPHQGVFFLGKYDANGNALWVKEPIVPNSNSYNYGNSVTVDGKGYVYLAGTFYDSIFIGPYKFFSAAPGTRPSSFIACYNTAGSLIWARQLLDLDDNTWYANSVAGNPTNQGGCYFNASTGQLDQGTPPYHVKFDNTSYTLNTASASATIFLQVDTLGSAVCGDLFSEGDEDDGDGIGVDPSGNYVYLGGDIFDKTIFGRDTLLYGQDEPFVARWGGCGNFTDTSLSNCGYALDTSGLSKPCNSLFIPNAFSPNGDLQNDVFYVRGNCISTMDFLIFDRWGNKVFESENQSFGWDGTYRGQPMTTGSYVWYLKATLNDGTIIDKKGSVALVR